MLGEAFRSTMLNGSFENISILQLDHAFKRLVELQLLEVSSGALKDADAQFQFTPKGYTLVPLVEELAAWLERNF